MKPCKHGHIDGAIHKPCPHCCIEKLEAELEQEREDFREVWAKYKRLREALKSCPCPCAAANGWHSAFTIGRCNIVGECECRYGKALEEGE